MKRHLPWIGFAAILTIAVLAVTVFDYSSAAHAHGFAGMIADGAAGAAATEELMREFKAHHTEVKSALEKAGVKDTELESRMMELEQKMSQLKQGGNGLYESEKSWGSQVVGSPQFKAIDGQRWKGRARFDVKTTATLTSASGGSAGDAGALVAPDRQTSPSMLPLRKLRMRDVLAPGKTTSNLVQWPKQTARSNNAATVAEGASKPQSDMTFTLTDWPVRTIAHWMLASRQVLDDAPALASTIDGDLLYDLAYVEDNQLLNGAGAGTDLVGIYSGATAFSAPFIPTAAGSLNKIDVLLLAIAQVQQMDYDPDFIAINPLDWADILVTKNEQGDYLCGGPFAAQAALLWTLPIVETRAMTLDNFLVGPGKRGAQIFDRQEAAVEISTEDSDNFRKNLVTLLAEERLALVIKAASAFVKGTFTGALAA